MKDIFPRSVQRQLFAVKLQRVYHLSLSVNPSDSQLQHEASTTGLQISKALNFTSRVFSCEFLYLLTWRTARPVKAGKGSKSHTHNRKFLGVVPSMILQIEKLNINNSIHSYSERDMKWWYGHGGCEWLFPFSFLSAHARAAASTSQRQERIWPLRIHDFELDLCWETEIKMSGHDFPYLVSLFFLRHSLDCSKRWCSDSIQGNKTKRKAYFL